eukprot:1449029-Pleurochrysis_carterae.AAC.1
MGACAYARFITCTALRHAQGSAKELGSLHAKFPCGLIRGALYGLGVNASVGVEVHKLTSCQFTIRIQTPDTK